MEFISDTIAQRLEQMIPGDVPGCSFDGSQWLAGVGERVEVNDPETGALALRYADAGEAQIEAVLSAAQHAGNAWAAFSARDRARCLRALATNVRARAGALAELESLSCGKVLKGAEAQVELVADMFEYYAGWADKFTGDVIPVPNGQLNYTVHEPVGVILQVIPWNSPLYLAAWNAAPALAMGNAVVLKPSELTPLTAMVLAWLSVQAGVPAGTLSVLAGLGHTVVPRAVADPRVKKVVFVGSTAVGRIVAAQAAARPIPCMLELGGKSANIVFADADLDKAAAAAVLAGYANSGQNCAAGSRLLVQRSIYDAFLEKLVVETSQYVVGSSLSRTTDIGPVVSQAQHERITRMIAQGVQEGGRLLTGGGAPHREGYFIQPTLLVDMANTMAVARQEIFGPVICVIPFDEEADAIAIANDSEFGLVGGVWTQDISRGHRVASKVNAGLLWINMYREMHVSSPFGGNDSSGYGRSSGANCLHEYVNVKSVWLPFNV